MTSSLTSSVESRASASASASTEPCTSPLMMTLSSLTSPAAIRSLKSSQRDAAGLLQFAFALLGVAELGDLARLGLLDHDR